MVINNDSLSLGGTTGRLMKFLAGRHLKRVENSQIIRFLTQTLIHLTLATILYSHLYQSAMILPGKFSEFYH